MLFQELTLSFSKEILYFILISCCVLFHIIKRKLIYYKYPPPKKPGNLDPDYWNCFSTVNCSFCYHLIHILKKYNSKQYYLKFNLFFLMHNSFVTKMGNWWKRINIMPTGSHQSTSQNKNEAYSSNPNLLERIGAGNRKTG